MNKTLNLLHQSLTNYQRRLTRVVHIGDIPLGGNYPIRVQSMTTTDTMDTKATVEQCIRMIEAGCEYVRITAPSIKEAENLKNIKAELKKRGYRTPLIADIHFTPNAAELAARIVEKVRINPGNYADKKKFQVIEYTDSEYQAEIERIYERFSPLVKICKEYGTAMRIGTNHGSLSDRILSRYGDTPEGMVESALEFLRICVDHNYHNVVLSMKASNTWVMIQAYRLLVKRIDELGWNYPLHLGVTEAGDGEDGRLKSAVGIGTLLAEGLGDTIRVSLTEDPEFEMPVAQKLVQYAQSLQQSPPIKPIPEYTTSYLINPYAYNRRKTNELENIGNTNVPRVIADVSTCTLDYTYMTELGYTYNVESDKWTASDTAVDYIYLGQKPITFSPPTAAKFIYDYLTWRRLKQENSFPLLQWNEFLSLNTPLPFISTPDEYSIPIAPLKNTVFFLLIQDCTIFWNDNYTSLLEKYPNAVLIFNDTSNHYARYYHRVVHKLMEIKLLNPVIFAYHHHLGQDKEVYQVKIGSELGALLADGLCDGIFMQGQISVQSVKTTFNVLQAARTRITKTEYISCPSCGRTLFNLQEVTAKIRAKTEHLKGVKIAVMGCIVNGPGEMADADYGYVGTGIGVVSLWRGKEIVKKGVLEKDALDELINLIKEDGRWQEPSLYN
ncbi:MAG: (E)-4-hydroxy-3-methylbut-2-enyl-diphosphate synthase [Bacteroidia bacterium]|nr:(E)-4-hydroxy-3-methylbut-2-enyl-diphosphate synthase [Bacteroidia bacterium]MDW8347427.1 (E)-4-hydroxy-3-methylbut-2-enyl-diphosphate synthase [Bacteroidia bacterium]